ncbi:MAG: tetratricopeptide repeat protein, partial [Dehalococcoidia bacterium]
DVAWEWVAALGVPGGAAIGALATYLTLRRQTEHERHARRVGAFEKQIAILETREKEAGTPEERQRRTMQRAAKEDEYLAFLADITAPVAKRIVESRAPVGVISADQPPLPEMQRQALERAASLFSASPEAKTFDDLFRLGNAFYEAGAFERALEHYTAALNLRPDDPATLHNRGAALADLKRLEEALRDYERSLELRPDDPATLNNRGAALAHQQRYEEALRDYNRSLEILPDHPDTLYNLACAHSLMERFDVALEELAKAIAGDEDNRRLAREDEDFARLRDDAEWGPRFWALVGKEDG